MLIHVLVTRHREEDLVQVVEQLFIQHPSALVFRAVSIHMCIHMLEFTHCEDLVEVVEQSPAPRLQQLSVFITLSNSHGIKQARHHSSCSMQRHSRMAGRSVSWYSEMISM
jgi:hypothetical protein